MQGQAEDSAPCGRLPFRAQTRGERNHLRMPSSCSQANPSDKSKKGVERSQGYHCYEYPSTWKQIIRDTKQTFFQNREGSENNLGEERKKHNEEFSHDSLTSTCFVLSATFIFFICKIGMSSFTLIVSIEKSSEMIYIKGPLKP